MVVGDAVIVGDCPDVCDADAVFEEDGVAVLDGVGVRVGDHDWATAAGARAARSSRKRTLAWAMVEGWWWLSGRDDLGGWG